MLYESLFFIFNIILNPLTSLAIYFNMMQFLFQSFQYFMIKFRKKHSEHHQGKII